MAPTNLGVQKQSRQTAATPVYSHDGTNIVMSPSSSASSSSRSSFGALSFPNVPPGITRRQEAIDSPFTQFTQSPQGYNPMGMGMGLQQQQQFAGSDPLSSSSAPTPTPTPGPNSGFQSGYYAMNNNNMGLMRQMNAPNGNGNFYPNSGPHSGTLGPVFGNGMQPIQDPFSSPSMQQQSPYGMGMNFNMGFGFPNQHPQQNGQFNMQGGMYNMMPFNNSPSNNDFSSYEPPSTSSSDTPPDRDFSSGTGGDGSMDVELDMDSIEVAGGSYSQLLSPSTEMLTSPASDRAGLDNGSMDTVIKGEDLGTSTASLSPPLLSEAKLGINKTPLGGNGQSKPPLPSSKEKEQNKQKLYRNRKSEFTNKMRDELLEMGMLPSTRVTHAPEIMSKTADTLRDYRELLELIQTKVEGMPSNIAAVPGAVKKLLNENGNVFNHTRQPPQLSLAQPQQQQQQQVTHTFKPDIKVPLGPNVNNGPLTGRVTRSGAHVF